MSIELDALHGGVDLESLDESRGIGRRTFLMGAFAFGAAAAAPINYAAAARRAALPVAKEGAFDLGVASGFPRPQGITLWTHLKGIGRNSKVTLTVAKDRGFNNVVKERLVTVSKKQGFTARRFVNDLKPHEEYFYRFSTENSKSDVGRFRTAPPLNSKEKIRIAYFSCQNYEAGFFNAQSAIAKEKDIDLVICLGDYMYEYSDNDGVRLDRTGRNKDGDVQFVDEYWQKYTLYKKDKDLQAMHAAHPFISVWDDHEVEDNHADGQPSSAQSDPSKTNLKNLPRRVSYAQRRMNGYKAFFNFMPRMRFKGDRSRIYEDYRLGKLVDLMLTDERQYRDPQPCNDAQLTACPEQDDPRTMLGEAQRNWLLRSLKGSPATWKVWGTQLMVMATRLSPGVAAQVDAWDGYGFERTQILNYILDNGVQNVVALTGDIHTFFAGTAYSRGDRDAPGSRAAFPEFVGGSATSSGLPEATGIPAETLAFLATVNPHIDFYDFVSKGYGVVTAGPKEFICELKGVDHKTRGAGTSRLLAKYRVPLGSRTPQRIA